MAKSEVRLSKRALCDLDAIAAYIAQQGVPKTAFAYVDRIEARCLEIGDFPKAGRALSETDDSLRAVPFEGVLIIYRLTPVGVRVVAVFNQRQDYARKLQSLR